MGEPGLPLTTGEGNTADLDAISRRWYMGYDRGAHDYTDAGCRVLAEHGFADVAALLAECSRLREQLDAARQALRGIDSFEKRRLIDQGQGLQAYVRAGLAA